MTAAPLLTLRAIGKRFGGVTALDGVDFELRAGEIHALLGENGAGKSTLIRILGGIHPPDAGVIQVDGRAVTIRDVADADRLGIRLIHQELSLAPNLSVAENLFLGREPVRLGFLDRRRLLADAEALITELGLPEIGSVQSPVADLSVAQQQMVEIARALIRLMVGRDLREHYPRPPWNPGAVALTVRQLQTARVRGVSFELRYGEILGFAGLVGAGRTDLARALFGIDPHHGGEILVDGKPATIRCPGDALSAGLALVPEDRKREGLVMTGSVAFNLALPWTREWIRGCVPDWQRRAGIVAHAVQSLGIRLSDPEQPIGSLSGGNQQKVVVGKWMERPPRILMLDEPTRGVDVGAREEMFAIMHRLVEQGMAVILISSDLPEVMNLSHRLALYRDGRIVREVASRQVTPEEVMAELTRN